MSLLKNNYPQFPLNWEIGVLPSEAECHRLWEKYEMFDNIREHSELVAKIAYTLALEIEKVCICPDNYAIAAHRAGLLHDIAKTYSIKNGGSHQQLGASIIRAETANPLLASCVLHHVVWPWEEGILGIQENIFHLPFLITYSDKRVKHNTIVSLDERFQDLFARYGHTEEIRYNIQLNWEQAQRIEKALELKLNIDLTTFIQNMK